jgi:hypothetical protein
MRCKFRDKIYDLFDGLILHVFSYTKDFVHTEILGVSFGMSHVYMLFVGRPSGVKVVAAIGISIVLSL